MKRMICTMLVIVMLLPLCGCGEKSEAAAVLDEMILQLGEISTGSGDDIRGLEEAVDRLDSADRKRLDNLKLLEQAREKYDTLCVGQVELQILAIGNVTLDSEDAIKSARSAYNALDDSAKALVSNLQVLTDAEQALDRLKVKFVEDPIDSIGMVDINSGHSIIAAREAYEALEAELQPAVGNKQALDEAIIEYKQAIINRARSVYNEMDCSESIEVINNGLDVLAADETLMEYLALFEAAAPKFIGDDDLVKLDVDNAKLDTSSIWTPLTDNKKSYSNCYVFKARGGSAENGILKVYLGGEYENFRAVIFPCFEKLKEDDTVRMIIYGDNGQVLYDSDEMGRTAEVRTISLNVEGVKELTIKVTSTYIGGWSVGAYDAICLADAFFWNPLADSDFDNIH